MKPVSRSVYAAFLILTFTYLLVEVPFAADLLDVLSSTPDHDAIEAIEHTGRLISGAALALALVGMLVPYAVRRSWPFMKTAVWSAVVCAGSVYGVYHGEKGLIDAIAENTSAEFRQGAAFAVLAKEEVLSGAGLQGYTLDRTDPASLVFAAFIPAAARGDDVIFDSFNRSAKAALVSSSMSGDVLSMTDFRTKVLARAIEETENRRDMLVSRRASYGLRESDAVDFANENWVRAHGVYQARIDDGDFTRGFRQVFINMERSRGIPLKSDFFSGKNQEAKYKQAARGAYFGNLEQKYRQRSGEGIPAEMTWPAENRAEFYKVGSVQRDLKKALGIESFDGTVSPSMSAEMEKSLYAAVKAQATRDFQSRFFQKAGVFGDRGPLKDAGIDAARMAIVPIFAIGLSLFGAFVHVCKLVNFGMLFASPALARMPVVRIAVSLAVGIGGASLMHKTPNNLASQPYVEKTRELLMRDMGTPASMVLEASMSVQRSFYPVAKHITEYSPLKRINENGVQVADLVLSNEDIEKNLSDNTTNSIPVPTPRP